MPWALALLASPAGAFKPNHHNFRGCDSCHLGKPTFGAERGKGEVAFRLPPDDPVLCLPCHKPQENIHPVGTKPGEGTLGTVRPSKLPLGVSGDRLGKVVCVTCHAIHADDADHALLRGMPGDRDPKAFPAWRDLCRDCHGQKLVKRSPHGGDDRACTFCHGSKPEAGERAMVTPEGGRLCNFCHGGLQDRHFEKTNPFGGEVLCKNCHDPHAPKEQAAGLKESYLDAVRNLHTSSPHYLKTLCFACHREDQPDLLLTTNGTELCNRCHGTGETLHAPHPMPKLAGGRKLPVGWPLLDGAMTCLTCHRAGHQDDRPFHKFLRGGPYANRGEVCPQCHPPGKEARPDPHQEGGDLKTCEICHTLKPDPALPESGLFSLRAAPLLLCLRCHPELPHPAGFDHVVTVSAKRAAQIPRELPLGEGRKISCFTCHNPHVSDMDNSKFRFGVAGIEICVACHNY